MGRELERDEPNRIAVRPRGGEGSDPRRSGCIGSVHDVHVRSKAPGCIGTQRAGNRIHTTADRSGDDHREVIFRDIRQDRRSGNHRDCER
jgi:hypothetical protein